MNFRLRPADATGSTRGSPKLLRPSGTPIRSRRMPTARKRLDPEYAQTYICVMMQQAVFQILADPTRLRIVEALAGGEQAVGELVRAVDIDQSGVSRHLRILGEAGFVAVRPDGARRLYSL